MPIANAVDATYRSDLRELNELNFARFDAKLEQRVSTLEARIEQRFGTLEAKMEQRIATLEATGNERLALLEARLERRLGEQSRWLFAAWASLLIPIIGLWMQ
jgi:hypothetical protein